VRGGVRLPLAAALLLLLLAPHAACKKEDKGDGSVAKPADKGGAHECAITVAARPPAAEPITGSGSGKDEAAATEAAWTEACGKLPPPEQPACRDANRYRAAVGTATVGQELTVTVTLTPAPPPQVTGNAASDQSQAAACQAALLDACEKAGGEGDCVTAGSHEKKGEVAGSRSAP
jgi:hypothetical protein